MRPKKLIQFLCSSYHLLPRCWGRTMKYFEVMKYGPSLQDPFVKTEGLIFHGNARAIQSVASCVTKMKILQKFTENFPKNYFAQTLSLVIFLRVSIEFQILPKIVPIDNKIIFHKFCLKHYPEF